MKRIAKFLMIIAGSYGIIYMLLYAFRLWWIGHEFEVISRAMLADPYMHVNYTWSNENMAATKTEFMNMLDDTIKEMGEDTKSNG